VSDSAAVISHFPCRATHSAIRARNTIAATVRAHRTGDGPGRDAIGVSAVSTRRAKTSPCGGPQSAGRATIGCPARRFAGLDVGLDLEFGQAARPCPVRGAQVPHVRGRVCAGGVRDLWTQRAVDYGDIQLACWTARLVILQDRGSHDRRPLKISL